MKKEVEGLIIVKSIRTGTPLTLDGFRTNFCLICASTHSLFTIGHNSL